MSGFFKDLPCKVLPCKVVYVSRKLRAAPIHVIDLLAITDSFSGSPPKRPAARFSSIRAHRRGGPRLPGRLAPERDAALIGARPGSQRIAAAVAVLPWQRAPWRSLIRQNGYGWLKALRFTLNVAVVVDVIVCG